MDLRELPPVLPLHLFEVEIDIPKKGKVLSDYAEFLDEESFHEMRMGASEEGLTFQLKVSKGFEKAYFPQIEKGDGLELFIDTRGIKDALVIHKYCHHFVFLPKEVDGIIGVEITRFKTGETRELCTKELLKVTTFFTKNSYTMEIQIPREALFGYDPAEYSTIRMAYIVHKGASDSNHFPKSARELNLKDYPSLWAYCCIK